MENQNTTPASDNQNPSSQTPPVIPQSQALSKTEGMRDPEPLDSKTPEKPKGKIPKPALIGRIVFLILAILAGVAFSFKDNFPGLAQKPTPTPAPVVTSLSPTAPPVGETSNLKTYINKEYGYSFSYSQQDFRFGEYPNKVSEIHPSSGKYSYAYLSEAVCEAYCPGFGVYAFENLDKWNLEKWITTSDRSPIKIGANELENELTECINKDPRTKQTKETFLGKNSITLEFSIDQETIQMKNKGICSKDLFIGGAGGFQKWVIINNSGEIIAIQINYGGDSDNINVKLDQILSTFKFTEV